MHVSNNHTSLGNHNRSSYRAIADAVSFWLAKHWLPNSSFPNFLEYNYGSPGWWTLQRNSSVTLLLTSWIILWYEVNIEHCGVSMSEVTTHRQRNAEALSSWVLLLYHCQRCSSMVSLLDTGVLILFREGGRTIGTRGGSGTWWQPRHKDHWLYHTDKTRHWLR